MSKTKTKNLSSVEIDARDKNFIEQWEYAATAKTGRKGVAKATGLTLGQVGYLHTRLRDYLSHMVYEPAIKMVSVPLRILNHLNEGGPVTPKVLQQANLEHTANLASRSIKRAVQPEGIRRQNLRDALAKKKKADRLRWQAGARGTTMKVQAVISAHRSKERDAKNCLRPNI